MKPRQAYAHCTDLASRHNPYFRRLARNMPRRLRRSLSALYAFACLSRDYADADGDSADRLAALDALEAALDNLDSTTAADEPVLIALQDTVRRYNLSVESLRGLLQAYRLDATKTRYADFDELMDYCRGTANPIGRLLLQIQGVSNIETVGYADGLCCALQLLGILCNLREDYRRHGRIYLPQDEMARFQVSEEHWQTGRTDPAMQHFMSFQLNRVHYLLSSGSPLGRVLRGRNGIKLRLIILLAHHLIVLKKQQQDAFFQPTRVGVFTWLILGSKAVLRVPNRVPSRFSGRS